ncbi:uncharacterized protein LOC131673922 [Phymastichus coffea]|uniref:uncharacterized protein LOC131673922 n=1 Tax=Phymastichus coffea TaxID=108790 RepID=UPI00273B1E0F|nr:uncharacterized protein LOC131673922 [Phymastichus coffea]
MRKNYTSARFLIKVLTLIILLVNSIYVIQVSDASMRTLDRDEWWSAIKYDDKPRIFNWKQHTPCPAKYFYLDCDDCRCIRGTLGGCTKMGCSTPQILNYADGMECPAGKPFYSNCNDCTCHEDGKSATCTERECPEPEER